MTSLSRPDTDIPIKRSPVRRIVLLALKGCVSVVILWLLIEKIDFRVFSDRLNANAIGPLSVGLVSGILIMMVTAVRWWSIHRRMGAPISFPISIPVTMECYALNLALPGSVGGDVVRVARAKTMSGKFRESIMAVLLDRGGNLATQMLLCLIALPFLHSAMASRDLKVAIFSIAAMGLAGLLVIYGAPPLFGRSRIRRFFLARELIRAGFILRRIVHLPIAVLEVGILSVVIQALNVLMMWTAVLAVGHMEAPFLALVIAMAFGMLGSALPISFGGLGVREGAVVWVLLETGMAENDAFMIAIVYGALVISQAIPGLLILLSGRLPPIIAR